MTNQYKKSTKYDGGMALGLFNSFGISYQLNKKLLISSELFMNSMSYAPSKSELIEYYVNGENKLNTKSLYERQTEYLDNFTSSLSNNSQPKKDLKQNIPFSSIGFNIGLVFSFKCLLLVHLTLVFFHLLF